MNMISTGAFLNEMDASNKQQTIAEKFAAVWEKKNAKAARAGGVSLMALSLAACGGSSSTTATSTTTDTTTTTTPVAPTNQSFTLTSSALDAFTGGDGNDTFSATSATAQTSDSLVGGAGTDTLSYVDSSASGTALPTLSLDSIETVSVTNISGAATAASNEVATVTFKDLAAGQTVAIGGITFTAGSSGATAANVAAALVDGTITGTNAVVTGGVLTGTTAGTTASADTRTEVVALQATAGYVTSAGPDANSVTFTATGANFVGKDLTNLQASGTAVSGIDQVTTFAITTQSTDAITVNINGQSVAAANGANLKADADNIAGAINAYLGYTAATVAATSTAATDATDPHTVTVTTDSVVNIASISSTALAGTLSNTTAFAAAAAPTIAITDGVAAVSAYGNAMTVDGASWTGVTTVQSDRSQGDVTFSGMTTNAEVTVSNTNASTADTTASFAAKVVAGTADTATLNLVSNTSAGTITIGDSSGTGFETLNINATGKNTVSSIVSKGASTVNITADAATNIAVSSDVASAGTLTVSGAGKVTLNTLDTAFDTVDASGNSGGIVVTDAGDKATVYTLGSGADKFTTAADGFASTDKFAVDAGAGEDTLVLAAAADVSTAGEAARYSNFEVVQVGDFNQDLGLLSGLDKVTLTAASNRSHDNLTAAQAQNITVNGNQATGVTLILDDATGTADVVNIDLKSATASTNVSVNALSIAGVETLNVTGSTGTAASNSDVDIAASGADKLTAVNFSGLADMSFTATNTAKAITFTSTTTGKTTVDGNFVTGSTVTTAGGKDAIALGSLGTTYNSGAGNDAFTSSDEALVYASGSYNTIDGGAGTDTLTITNNDMTLTDVYFAKMSNMETLVLDGSGAAGGESVTIGTNFTSAFGSGAVLNLTSGAEATTLDASSYAGGLTSTITSGATTVDTTVTGGAGNDTLSLVATAATTSTIAMSGGDGDDTLTLTLATTYDATSSDTITLTGGKGADTISMVDMADADSVLTSIVFAAGDSTVTAFDTIKGMQDSETTNTLDSQKLDFSGTAAVATDVTNNAVTGYTAAELKISSVKGLVSFTGTSAASLGFDAKLKAVQETFIGSEETAIFVHGDHSYVFHNETGTDTLVKLADFTDATVLELLSGTAGDGELVIA